MDNFLCNILCVCTYMLLCTYMSTMYVCAYVLYIEQILVIKLENSCAKWLLCQAPGKVYNGVTTYVDRNERRAELYMLM